MIHSQKALRSSISPALHIPSLLRITLSGGASLDYIHVNLSGEGDHLFFIFFFPTLCVPAAVCRPVARVEVLQESSACCRMVLGCCGSAGHGPRSAGACLGGAAEGLALGDPDGFSVPVRGEKMGVWFVKKNIRFG